MPITAPVMLPAQTAGDWTVLPTFAPLPGLGVIGINSFLLKSREPVLVDTGLNLMAEPYMAALEAEIDLADLRWIWLSHTDPDHIGNLPRILARAPKAKVVTTFLGMAKMELLGHDLTRVHLLQPGDRLDLGARSLVPIRPPYYDAPETMGFYDTGSRALFAADSFGAVLPDVATEFAAIDTATLRDGLVAWSSIDAPWLAMTDRKVFAESLHALRGIDPEMVLSGHLPVARNGIDRLTSLVHDAWCAGPTSAMDPLSIKAAAAALA